MESKLFLFIILLFSGLFSEPTYAIVGGSPLSGRPAIVGLATDGRIDCSGVLVSESFVLTAAHCVAGVKAHEIGIHLGSGAPEGQLSSQQKSQLLSLRANGIAIHPLYMDNELFKRLNQYFFYPEDNVDLAILELSAPVVGIQTFPQLLTTPLADGQKLSIEIVGFGGHGENFAKNKMFSVETGEKYHLQMEIVPSFEEEHFRLSMEQGHIYVGDSGGPAFVSIDGQQYLFGVHSGVDSILKKQSYHARIATNICWIESQTHMGLPCQLSLHQAKNESFQSIDLWKDLVRNGLSYQVELPQILDNLSVRESKFILNHLFKANQEPDVQVFFEKLILHALRSSDKALVLSGLGAASKLPVELSGPWILEAMNRDFVYYHEDDLTTVAASTFLQMGAEVIPFLAGSVKRMEPSYQKINLLRVLKRLRAN